MIETVVYDRKGKNLIKTEVSPPKAALLENKDILVWINLNHFTEEEAKAVLEDLFQFHHLAIEDCFTYSNYPKFDLYDNYTFLVMHTAKFHPDLHKLKEGENKDVQSREIDFFIGTNYLITVHQRSILTIPTVMNLCEKNPEGTIARGIDYLLYLILDEMMNNYQPMMDLMEDKIEKFDEMIFQELTPEILSEIFTLKKDLISLRRVLIPQREVINRLARGECPQISKKFTIYFRDVSDEIFRCMDLIENYRETLISIQDAFLSITSNKLNKVILTLTIIATLILTPTVITGFYGMNIKNLPFANSEISPLIIFLFIFVTTLGLVYYLKRKKWF